MLVSMQYCFRMAVLCTLPTISLPTGQWKYCLRASGCAGQAFKPYACMSACICRCLAPCVPKLRCVMAIVNSWGALSPTAQRGALHASGRTSCGLTFGSVGERGSFGGYLASLRPLWWPWADVLVALLVLGLALLSIAKMNCFLMMLGLQCCLLCRDVCGCMLLGGRLWSYLWVRR